MERQMERERRRKCVCVSKREIPGAGAVQRHALRPLDRGGHRPLAAALLRHPQLPRPQRLRQRRQGTPSAPPFPPPGTPWPRSSPEVRERMGRLCRGRDRRARGGGGRAGASSEARPRGGPRPSSARCDAWVGRRMRLDRPGRAGPGRDRCLIRVGWIPAQTGLEYAASPAVRGPGDPVPWSV